MTTIDSLTGTLRQQLAQEGVAFSGAIASAAQKYGLDPELLAAVAAQETGGPGSNAGANIVGDRGHGHGLFQIDDRWHRFASTPAAMDPVKNAEYAAGMLSGLLKRYGGNPESPAGRALHQALSAYNAGNPNARGTTTTWADGQTLGYADSVLRHYKSLAAHRGNHQVQTASPLAPGSPGSLFASLSMDDQQNLIGEIFSEIQTLNALRSLAQTSPSGAQSMARAPAQFTPPSYSQLAGIDRSGHSKNDTSWAGVIDAGDDSN